MKIDFFIKNQPDLAEKWENYNGPVPNIGDNVQLSKEVFSRKVLFKTILSTKVRIILSDKFI